MTIEYQIKDEKLQYYINREAAKISALSSGKIDKYEYLTGEEILPSNQQQMIEQAKFSCSPLGKAFEKQTNTIKDQGEKQIKAIQDKDFNKLIEKTEIYSDNDYKKELILKKEREIFKKIYNKILNQVEYLNDGIDYDNLKYTVINSGEKFEFDRSEDPILFLDDIKEGKISVEQAKNIQEEYKKYLNKIRKGNKTTKQKETIDNMSIIFNTRDKVINFIEDYGSMILEAKRLAKQKGTRLKTITPNQMLKRLPIAPAQISAGNNSESLLNEIRQTAYSLYRSKKLLRKYTTT